jgi:hypothetical protein
MEGIKEYLLGVISAAILCAIVSQIPGKGSFANAAIKLIAGVFMLLALASPIIHIRLKPADILTDISAQANQITASAAAATKDSIAQSIKERTQTYILDKANSLGADLTIEVMLSDGEIQEPVSVSICGNISPYSKKILSETIAKDLGIGTEAQIWT